MPVPRRALAIAALLVAGCVGELRELPPPDGGGRDGAADGPSRDAASDGGGGVPVRFAPTIQDDLDGLGCTTMACHGGGAPMRVLPRASGADLVANYGEVRPRASEGEASPLLRKPLVGGMVGHAGGLPFKNTSDPIYQRWLAWIRAGAPSGLDGPDGGVDLVDGGSDL